MPQQRRNVADGQVAAAAASIYAAGASSGELINLIFQNTGSSSETLVITLLRQGGTARRVFRGVLSPNDQVLITGLAVDEGDTVKATTTNASVVDYVVSIATPGAPFKVSVFDGSGAPKLATSTTGYAATSTSLLVKKTAIANNTATPIITFTVPNANHAAACRILLLGSLGTGTDTFESSRCAEGCVIIARQADAAIVPAAATLTLAQISTVSGGGTLTLAYAVSAVVGAAGATNTFTIDVTLVKTGTITDLQCVAFADLLNAEASGVTMAAA